ncbi:MAG: prepilin-type N-terminal cleavage/methylation domain-containing protein [Gammaproteobacteria bacterium]|nr:prepilin-type N-terminal cleavage/methylation domain-containing protein [Gammaproteobacteria bacterium]
MTPAFDRVPGRNSGFTLIELALVLFILALVLGGLLAPLSVRMEQNERNQTEKSLAEINEALYGFAVVNGRLPCPDYSPGNNPTHVENCASMSGTVAVQWLPAATLGVSPYDAWGRRFRYAVNVQFADATPGTGGCSGSPALGVSFELCSTASIDVRDSADAGSSNVVTAVPAIVVSFGANGGTPANSTHEQENQDSDAVFVLKSYSRDSANEFDDLLTWISPTVLMNRMVVAGRLP